MCLSFDSSSCPHFSTKLFYSHVPQSVHLTARDPQHTSWARIIPHIQNYFFFLSSIRFCLETELLITDKHTLKLYSVAKFLSFLEEAFSSVGCELQWYQWGIRNLLRTSQKVKGVVIHHLVSGTMLRTAQMVSSDFSQPP